MKGSRVNPVRSSHGALNLVFANLSSIHPRGKTARHSASNGVKTLSKNFWWKNAVIYQIYPLSFKDSNDDGFGDLKGIIQKLDYLNDGTKKSLGVDAIWLNPIYKSPMKDFGYDVSDYYDIDPIFGDLETFARLIKEAHRRGIKVIMDFIPNHTSQEHSWFLESRASKTNPKRDWYIWRDPKPDGAPPNNWLSRFGGSAWSYDKLTKQYYLHTFLPEQPDLNWRNSEVREEMFRMMKFWLDRGVDGFRTDAITHLIKDKKFRDDPPNPNYEADKDEPYDSLLHIYSAGGWELIKKTTRSFCKVLGEYGSRFMVSETNYGIRYSLDIPGLMKYYKTCEDKQHVPFNFNFITMPWDARIYKKFIDKFEAHLLPGYAPTYVLGNHDRSRIATRLGQKRARLAVILQAALRGTMFIYYGEELGMEDAIIPSEKVIDPWGKNVSGLRVGRDPARTPMQWNGSKYAGFSSTAPWLPYFTNPKIHNVETESRDKKSMLAHYRFLIHFWKRSPALLEGIYKPMASGNSNILIFARIHKKENVLAVLNFSDKEQRAKCDNIRRANVVCSTYLDQKIGGTINVKTCVLRPYEGYILTF